VKLITHLHLEPNLIMTTGIVYSDVWLLDEHRKNCNVYVNIGLSIMMYPGSRLTTFNEKIDREI